MTRVLIAAAYAAVRAGLHALLESHGAQIEVVGHASGPAELEALLHSARPDAVLLDLPEADADDLGRVLDLLARSDVAAVLMGESPRACEALLERPLRGWAWLAREAEGAEIAAAVRAASAGLAAFDRSRLDLLLAHAAPEPAVEPTDLPEHRALTPREGEVLQLLAAGLPNKSIAARLGVSTHTAKFHVASILSKLGASSRAEAVAIAARSGQLML